MINLHFIRQQGKFNLNTKCIIETPTLGLFGVSGAGKSTLLSMVAGLTVPTSGHLTIDDEVLFDSARGINMPPHQRNIGIVLQDSRLFPHLNVKDNLQYGYQLLPEKKKRFSFNQIVDLLELSALMNQKPHQLSGGEKQRVALGRALLISPRLLLLDEPLASLDVRLKQQILPFLRRIKDEINIPMIYVSHAIDEILYLTNQIALLEHGKILAIGALNEVMHHTDVLALTHSLGLENILQTSVLAHYTEDGYTLVALSNQQTLSIPLNKAAIGAITTISIAAASIALAQHALTGISIQNQVAGKVTRIQQIGTKVLVTVQIDAAFNTELVAEITTKALQTMSIEQGSHVMCLFKTQSIRTLAN